MEPHGAVSTVICSVEEDPSSGKAYLSTNDNDAWQKFPETGQSFVTCCIVPQQRCRTLQPIDQLYHAVHRSLGSMREAGLGNSSPKSVFIFLKFCFQRLVGQQGGLKVCYNPEDVISCGFLLLHAYQRLHDALALLINTVGNER